MSDIASITVTGRITRDGEVRYTTNGTPVLKFSLACNRWKANESKTSFYDCELWGKYGEAKAKIATKGVHVVVTGTLDIDEFDGQNGKVRKPIITVSFVEPSPNQSNSDGGSQDYAPRQQKQSRDYKPAPKNDSYGPESFDDDIPF